MAPSPLSLAQSGEAEFKFPPNFSQPPFCPLIPTVVASLLHIPPLAPHPNSPSIDEPLVYPIGPTVCRQELDAIPFGVPGVERLASASVRTATSCVAVVPGSGSSDLASSWLTEHMGLLGAVSATF